MADKLTDLFSLLPLHFSSDFQLERVKPDKTCGKVRVEMIRVHGRAMFSTWNEYVFKDSGVAS